MVKVPSGSGYDATCLLPIPFPAACLSGDYCSRAHRGQAENNDRRIKAAHIHLSSGLLPLLDAEDLGHFFVIGKLGRLEAREIAEAEEFLGVLVLRRLEQGVGDGAPLGLGFSATGGMVFAVARQVEPSVPLRLIQHDAAVNPGSSGGPLVDAEGRLIGMNSRIADGSRLFVGIAYALSAADLDRIVTGLVNGTLPPFPELGLRLRPVDRQIASALGIAPGGVLIDDVRSGSLSAIAGLLPGDVLLSLDGTRIAMPGDMAFAIDAALPLGRTEVLLHRDGIETELSLGLVPPPAPQPDDNTSERTESYDLASLGLQVDDSGVVAVVAESSPARFAGLATGDRVLRVNGIETGGAALQDLHLTAPALLLVQRGNGSTLHIYLDPWARTPGLRPVGGANVLDPAVVVF